MSKRSKGSNSRLNDWEVTTDAGEDNPPQHQDFPESWWKRDKRGWYTFRDAKGIAAEFAPGVVLKVRRLEVVLPDDRLEIGGLVTGGKRSEPSRALAAEAARTQLSRNRTNGGKHD